MNREKSFDLPCYLKNLVRGKKFYQDYKILERSKVQYPLIVLTFFFKDLCLLKSHVSIYIDARKKTRRCFDVHKPPF